MPGSLISLLISGDELLSDSFPYKETENGVLWEVEGKVSIFFLFLGLNFLFRQAMLLLNITEVASLKQLTFFFMCFDSTVGRSRSN